MVASKSLRLLWFTAGLCWDFDSIWVFLNLRWVWSLFNRLWGTSPFFSLKSINLDFEPFPSSSLVFVFQVEKFCAPPLFAWLWKKICRATKFFYHSLRNHFWVLLLWDGFWTLRLFNLADPAFKSEVLVDFTFHDGSLLIIRWTT